MLALCAWLTGCAVSFTERSATTNEGGVPATGDVEVFGLESRQIVSGLTLPATSSAVYPVKLSQTGIFADTAALTPRAGIIEYAVKFPHWSDGATHKNWIALPGQATITFSSDSSWEFPVGTVLIKHFELPKTASVQWRVETRLLIRFTTGWAGATYQWDANQLDATVLSADASQTFAVYDTAAAGSSRTQTWNFPSRSQCIDCHGSTGALGVRTEQLNQDFDYPTRKDNQLRSWSHIGLFDEELNSSSTYTSYPTISDSTVAAATRARTYLQVNCAHCHQPLAGVDLRLTTPLEDAGLRNVAANNNLGVSGLVRLSPGNKSASALYLRMTRTPAQGARMPPLGTSMLDARGIALIGEWIDGL